MSISISDPAPDSPPRGIAAPLLAWHRVHGRHGLPWQSSGPTPDPYHVWLSEVMLQQTQVSTVIPYFLRFIERWPDVVSLAGATPDEVMGAWSGLGYYSRARSLHRAAQLVVERHGGAVPVSSGELVTLPGIGRSTAAAIAAFCANERVAILDGNVRRVLARVFEVSGDPGSVAVQAGLWALAERELPSDASRMPAYTQAMMDLGATLCTRSRPRCIECPLAGLCDAHRHGTVAQYPGRRVRAARKPVSLTWLLLHDAESVIVTPRPGTGIWAGLWTLPDWETAGRGMPNKGEVYTEDVRPAAPPLPADAPLRRPPDPQAVQEWLARQGLAARMASALEPVDDFVHVLSHRDLSICVFAATVSAPDRSAIRDAAAGIEAASGARWMPLDAVDRAPLPGPLRQRLHRWIESSRARDQR